MRNIDKVLALIRKNPQGLDDDEIAEETRIEPRQQVQQLCSRLEAQGLVERRSVEQKGKRRKIHNFPAGTAAANPRPRPAGASWERRLAAIEAATSLNRNDILDQALADFAMKILKADLGGDR